MPTPVRKTIKNKNTNKKENKSDVWWLRKKVPERYRGVVGRREVWRSLETTDFKTAVVECHKLSVDLDKEWQDRLRAAQAAGRTPAAPVRTMTKRSHWRPHVRTGKQSSAPASWSCPRPPPLE